MTSRRSNQGSSPGPAPGERRIPGPARGIPRPQTRRQRDGRRHSGVPARPASGHHDIRDVPVDEESLVALRPVIAVAALGAVLSALAPVVGVVAGLSPGFLSWPWLAVLHLLPPVVAAWLAARRRPLVAAGVLAANAVLVPGRLLVDAQIAVDATRTARPELFVPTSLVPPGVGAGWFLLLAGDVAVGVAGLLAFRLAARSVGSRAEGAGRRHGLLTLALCAAAAAALGLATSPFASDNAFLWPQAVVDAPVWALLGGLLVVLAVPLTTALAAGAGEPDAAQGGLVGVALGVGAVAAPPLLAALAMPAVHLRAGPVLALLASASLVAVAGAAGRGGADGRRAPATELALPAAARLHVIAGGLGLAAGLVALVSPLLPQLSLPGGLPEPANDAARPLAPAGALVAALGAALLARSAAATTRPALAVAWVAVPMTAVSVLGGVLTATDLPGVRAGAGAWTAGLAALLALASGCCAALAGGVERDEVDLTALTVHRPLVVVGGLAAVAALGAFGLPLTDAPAYAAPGVWTQFRTASWGLLAGMLAVLVASAVAVRSRPLRSAALLLGAAGLVGVRLLEYPLGAGRVGDAGPGLGFWCAVACLVLLLTGAVSARSGARRSPRRGVTR